MKRHLTRHPIHTLSMVFLTWERTKHDQLISHWVKLLYFVWWSHRKARIEMHNKWQFLYFSEASRRDKEEQNESGSNCKSCKKRSASIGNWDKHWVIHNKVLQAWWVTQVWLLRGVSATKMWLFSATCIPLSRLVQMTSENQKQSRFTTLQSTASMLSTKWQENIQWKLGHGDGQFKCSTTPWTWRL